VTVRLPILAGVVLLLSCDSPAPEQKEWEQSPLPALPTEAQLAASCYKNPGEMMMLEAEEASKGVFIEPTYEEFIVRSPRCEWRDGKRRVAECRYEQSSIPFGEQEPPKRERYLRQLRDRDWQPASAMLVHDPVLGWARECRRQPVPSAPPLQE
jgi:hypothetical protein